ncbi:MAG: hypothetical protein KGQ66_22780 [Acidobacteriota bacterium]|nr:hypothetical protein [Acidobacteriota bacterium]
MRPAAKSRSQAAKGLVVDGGADAGAGAGGSSGRPVALIVALVAPAMARSARAASWMASASSSGGCGAALIRSAAYHSRLAAETVPTRFSQACAARGDDISVILRDRQVVARGDPSYAYRHC